MVICVQYVRTFHSSIFLYYEPTGVQGSTVFIPAMIESSNGASGSLIVIDYQSIWKSCNHISGMIEL